MTARRQPWWFSGDDAEQPDAVVDEDSGPDRPDGGLDEDSVSDGSADQGEPEPVVTGSRPGGDDASSNGIEWTALLAGAQRMVDWATEKVLAPHAEHTDPADHPQCVVCRTMVLIGEGRSLVTDDEPVTDPQGAGAEDVEAESGPVPATGEIMWIPIREQVREP
ncbi:MAG: hypothetical protein IPO93_14460 [Actinobacteria bacterium]|jgi:hypothetical protein|nr:hypothetical protein [Actinomycetota bacterium]